MERRPSKASGGGGAAALLLVVLGTVLMACGGASGFQPPPPAEQVGPAEETGGAPWIRDEGFPAPVLSFQNVSWMDLDRETGEIYLLQRIQPAVSIWSPEGRLLRTWSTDELGDPHSLTLHTDDDGLRSVWITDMAPPRTAGSGYGHCLKRFTLEGELLGTVGACGPDSQGTGLDPVQFDKVTDVAFDGGLLFVTDGDLDGLNNRLLAMTRTGRVEEVWGAPHDQPGSGPGEFDLPHDVLVDPCGRKWIADALNHRIQVIAGDGSVAGELACFGDDGVYGLALSAPRPGSGGDPVASLFVTTSPTDGGSGTVYVFDAPVDCRKPGEIGSCVPRTRWDVDLPDTGSTALLHAVTTNAAGNAIYISSLGGPLPPQKWIAPGSAEVPSTRRIP